MSSSNRVARSVNGVSTTSSKTDESIMNATIPTGINGVSMMLNSLEKGTTEVKNLLSNECDLILECKLCWNLFRSVDHFVKHKRSYCRDSIAQPLRSHVEALTEITDSIQQALATLVNEPTETSNFESVSDHLCGKTASNKSAQEKSKPSMVTFGFDDEREDSEEEEPWNGRTQRSEGRGCKDIPISASVATPAVPQGDYPLTDQKEDHPESKLISDTVPTVPARSMRNRSLKSPYADADFVNAWPSKLNSGTAAAKTNAPNIPPKKDAENVQKVVMKTANLVVPNNPDAVGTDISGEKWVKPTEAQEAPGKPEAVAVRKRGATPEKPKIKAAVPKKPKVQSLIADPVKPPSAQRKTKKHSKPVPYPQPSGQLVHLVSCSHGIS